MSATISKVVDALTAGHGTFSAQRFPLNAFQGLAAPLMGMDHYHMSDVTFAPHPHAGFSAISYVFEDSPGALRNRDSLGHDFAVEPGDVVWTQAGTGVVHDERPAKVGTEVHGLQIFVNLKAVNRTLAPQVYRLAARDIPVWNDGQGSRVRVVVGDYGGQTSTLAPAEPFNLFDAFLNGNIDIPVRQDWNAFVYAVDGSVRLTIADERRELKGGQAISIGVADQREILDLTSNGPAHLVIMSGPRTNEAVFQHGPFIMANPSEINDAIGRYQRGEMGSLASLSTS